MPEIALVSAKAEKFPRDSAIWDDQVVRRSVKSRLNTGRTLRTNADHIYMAVLFCPTFPFFPLLYLGKTSRLCYAEH